MTSDWADRFTPYRGFASFSEAKRKEVARLGGLAAQRLKVGHTWDSKEAAEAGRRGGLTTAARKRERARREAMQS